LQSAAGPSAPSIVVAAAGADRHATSGVIADVVFDVPLAHPLSYSVPPGLLVERGQRVSAPLSGRARTGMVVAVREGKADGLRPIERLVDAAPILSATSLELGRWVADESLSSWGSTMLSLLPPPPPRAEPVAPAPDARPGPARATELWVAATRHQRLDHELRKAGAALLVAPDTEAAARWATRLDAVRLDSGVPRSERRAAWFAAARGRARIAVGTRSALLVPLPPPATLVLLDEHDAVHKPPGAPRLHSRDVLARRAALEHSRLLLLSATPSVESWWRAGVGRLVRDDAEPGPWPRIVTADTRGILRNHPLTLPLTRAIEATARAQRSIALIVPRGAPTLVCGECGHVPRCPDCGVAQATAGAERLLRCRLCVRTEPMPDRCPRCGGHRLAPLGWDAERVEASVRRRFPKLAVSRSDPGAAVLIGPPALLRSRPPGSLGAVGIVALDAVLSAPDFRAGERAFALLWAAAEAVIPSGRVIAQTLHPDHYAIAAARAQARREFYEPELAFRAELGYPPFRRLCLVSARGTAEAEARRLIAECASALAGVPGLVVYPAASRAAGAACWQFAIKGPADLPRLLAGPFRPFLERRRRRGGMVEVEMDPV
jgi:primosomal protein N'